MQYRIEILPEKLLVGKRLRMSITNNRTGELWRNFMPYRSEIRNSTTSDLYSIEVYGQDYFGNFNQDRDFDKWAAMEVSDISSLPAKMEAFSLPSGLYAVFLHKGPASSGPITYRNIYLNWLPSSEFILDNRPHFAVMGVKYKSESQDSEEEIWIPVRLKNEPGSTSVRDR